MPSAWTGHSWQYWVAITIALVLIIIDIVGYGAAWSNVGALVFIAIAVLVRERDRRQ